ncbi:MAG: hypothetical protein Kow0032_06650 [Methyloligellaceae bacterium]
MAASSAPASTMLLPRDAPFLLDVTRIGTIAVTVSSHPLPVAAGGLTGRTGSD